MGDQLNFETRLTYLAQNSNLVPQLNYPTPMVSINTPTKFFWTQISGTAATPFGIPLSLYNTVVAIALYNLDNQYPLVLAVTPLDNASTNCIIAPGGLFIGTFNLDTTSTLIVTPQNPNPADSLLMIAGT